MLERKKQSSLGRNVFSAFGLGTMGLEAYTLHMSSGTAYDRAVYTGLAAMTAVGTYFAARDVSDEEIKEQRANGRPRLRNRIGKVIPLIVADASVAYTAYKYGESIPKEVFEAAGVGGTLSALGLGIRARLRRQQNSH